MEFEQFDAVVEAMPDAGRMAAAAMLHPALAAHHRELALRLALAVLVGADPGLVGERVSAAQHRRGERGDAHRDPQAHQSARAVLLRRPARRSSSYSGGASGVGFGRPMQLPNIAQ